ncbi:pyridoxamine 5'-phosphate oxidase family protein [Desulfoluna sp.]|uniref:pyridoxamine 5'-phosphate oxidase family protein n=1 Tax=Desulfoluna sp. TaxID=2045199 RepID=UPI002601E3BF|nr:pyridoxamine 5'-phosphate oxidase family protein [Desulfoluna sp.]
MRTMTIEEMETMLTHAGWATICTVRDDGTPYAVEATYFRDGADIGFMINPRGTTATHIKKRPDVLLKLTTSDAAMHHWAGISLFGKAEMVTEKNAMARGWDLLGEAMDTDYSKARDRFCSTPEKSPFLRVTVSESTGRCSARKGASMNWPFLPSKTEAVG